MVEFNYGEKDDYDKESLSTETQNIYIKLDLLDPKSATFIYVTSNTKQ